MIREVRYKTRANIHIKKIISYFFGLKAAVAAAAVVVPVAGVCVVSVIVAVAGVAPFVVHLVQRKIKST